MSGRRAATCEANLRLAQVRGQYMIRLNQTNSVTLFVTMRMLFYSSDALVRDLDTCMGWILHIHPDNAGR
jgi:hypothetical protein